MKFLHKDDEFKELTYEDVFLMPQLSGIASRMEVDLSPQNGGGMTIPIVVSNMTAVAGRRMAETVTRRGGIVVLPQDMSLDRIEEIVNYVKKCHHLFETPVVVKKHESVQSALNLIHKRAHKAIVVVDELNKPVGIFTEADVRHKDKFTKIEAVMTTDLVTVPSHTTPEEIFSILEEKRLSIVPVVNEDGTLAGVMTKKGALRAKLYKPAVNQKGELLTAVAVGVNRDLEATTKKLLEIGVDIIVLDTAHGHQEKMILAVEKVREIIGPHRILVAGNIVSEEAAHDLCKAGANILKVGVGPGAMCITRMMTGVGRPQFSAVLKTAEIAKQYGAHVWADGGVKHPRDVALAIAAGASAVMVGSWFAGTYESPADAMKDEQGRLYKENFGMASNRAVIDRNIKFTSYDSAMKQYFEEGISNSKLYLKPGSESVEDIIDTITAGVRSSCTYAGARSITELSEKAIVGVQSASGYKEGKPVSESW